MTNSRMRPQALQRFNSEPPQPPEPIEVLCERYSNRILDLIPPQLLDKAKDITLADMLESEITACETISWLINICKFTKYYGLNNTPDNIEFYQELLDIRNLLSTQAVHDCFKLSDALRVELKSKKYQSSQPNVFLASAARVEQKQTAPVKPCAEELTMQKTKELVMAYINKCRKDEQDDFTFDYMCELIEKNHLQDGKLRWSSKDQTVVGNDTVQWKSTISNALQFFQNKEDLKYLSRKSIWFVLPSYP